jgi:hypothetical protein
MPYADPTVKKMYQAEYHRRNAVKLNTYVKRWRASIRGVGYKLKNRYGISTDEYDALWIEQLGLCAICGDKLPGYQGQVDHCHLTGRVRGILCGPCNRGIGCLQDNPEIVDRASSYLRTS